VLNKLRLSEDSLDPLISITLAASLASLSDSFPKAHPDDRVYSIGARFQAARLIYHLVTNATPGTGEGDWKYVLERTPNLMFTLELAGMVRAFGEKIDSVDNAWVIASDGLERTINAYVAGRIAEQARSAPLEDTCSRVKAG